MNKLTWLMGLFALQLLLVIGFLWSKQSSDYDYQTQTFWDNEITAITRIEITGEENSVNLAWENDSWVTDGESKLPADAKKVGDFVESLIKLKAPFPVATTANSHPRFEVDDKKFQRKIVIFDEDKNVGEIYLGTSPGFRKVHARRSDQQEIFAVDLNLHEVFDTDEDWMDKALIAVPKAVMIKDNNDKITFGNDHWTSASAPDQKLSSDKVTELVDNLNGLRVLGLGDPKEAFKAEHSLEVQDETGERYTFEFMTIEEQKYVKRSDLDKVFRLYSGDYDTLTQDPLAGLSEPEPGPTATPGTTGGTGLQSGIEATIPTAPPSPESPTAAPEPKVPPSVE